MKFTCECIICKHQRDVKTIQVSMDEDGSTTIALILDDCNHTFFLHPKVEVKGR